MSESTKLLCWFSNDKNDHGAPVCVCVRVHILMPLLVLEQSLQQNSSFR